MVEHGLLPKKTKKFVLTDIERKTVRIIETVVAPPKGETLLDIGNVQVYKNR